MSRVMFDIDGVLRNWNDAWRNKFKQKFGEMPEEPTVWEAPFLAAKAVGHENPFDLFFVDWGWDLTANAEPYPGAKKAVRDLKAAGHRLIFATDQPTNDTKAGTLAWLSKQYMIPDELVFTDKKYSVDAEFYIDDNDRNIFKLALHKPDSNIVRILRPWNEKYSYEGLPIWTIKRLSQYVELVNGESELKSYQAV